jgi:hypothetical protein
MTALDASPTEPFIDTVRSRGSRAAAQRSLAAAAGLATSQTTVPAWKRRDIDYAVRWVERIIGRPATVIPADFGWLGERLASVCPAAWNLEDKTWSNIRSSVSFVLAARMPASNGHSVELSPEWQAAWDALPQGNKNYSNALRPLIRFCNNEGIAPAMVNDATLARYRTHLETCSLHRDPRTSHQNACRLHNRACDEISGWVGTKVQVPCYGNSNNGPEECLYDLVA